MDGLHDDDYTIAYEPENTLRKIIGADIMLDDLFTPEKIRACQKLINVAKKSFFDTTQSDVDSLKKLIQEAYPAFEQISSIAENIHGEAKMLGFPFISSVCRHISDFCESSAHSRDIKITIIEKLVEALHAALKNKIRDEGGDFNRKLAISMATLK